jgi:hypothetical protein
MDRCRYRYRYRYRYIDLYIHDQASPRRASSGMLSETSSLVFLTTLLTTRHTLVVLTSAPFSGPLQLLFEQNKNLWPWRMSHPTLYYELGRLKKVVSLSSTLLESSKMLLDDHFRIFSLFQCRGLFSLFDFLSPHSRCCRLVSLELSSQSTEDKSGAREAHI